MTETLEQTRQQRAIDVLKDVAQYYKKFPDAPLPYSISTYGSTWICLSSDSERRAQELRTIGSFEKNFSETEFRAEVQLKHTKLIFYTSRENVCTKRVVGTKHVEREVIPEKIIEAHDEELYEWDCPESILNHE